MHCNVNMKVWNVTLSLVLGALNTCVVCCFVGCQALVYGTASDLNKLSVGMTKPEVISVLGRPISSSADADKGEEQLIYKRMKHAISEWPRTYAVTLRQGRVVKFGEQYDERNVNNF